MVKNYCLAVPHFAAGCGIMPADIAATGGEMRSDWREMRSLQRDASGALTGEEIMRGPRKYAFTPGGRLSLYAAPRAGQRPRLLVARGPFEALCAAAYEGHREDTVYAAPPGRLVPLAREALIALAAHAATRTVVVAVGEGGDGLADQITDAIGTLPGRDLRMELVEVPQGSWVAAMRTLKCRSAAA